MMKDVHKALQVSEHVYWVGAIDWALRDFHGYATSRGSTYNAFLIVADKIALVDTVKSPFRDEMLARIESVVDPKKIDIIISNHTEMDHSGCLPEMIDLVQPEAVYASIMGHKGLDAHFGLGDKVTAVREGESVSLGNMNVSFIETRMCHWPDSMFTYLDSDQVLFSQDGFGMHLASFERFADEMDSTILDYEAAKYYANILLPLSKFITKALEKFSSAQLPVKLIAPDHGPLYRRPEDIQKIISQYAQWAQQKPSNKAVVVYDTMWQSTAEMARAIAQGIYDAGSQAKVLSLSGSHRSDIATEMLDAGALVVGSPTINNNIFPTVADAMSYLKGLKPLNRIAAAFGSYGWSGEAPKQLRAMLEEMNFEIVGDPLRVQYVPQDQAIKDCYELGQQIAVRLQEISSTSQQ